MDYICGEPLKDIMDVIRYAKENNYQNLREMMEHLSEPREYKARVSLLKTRLERIKAMTEVQI